MMEVDVRVWLWGEERIPSGAWCADKLSSGRSGISKLGNDDYTNYTDYADYTDTATRSKCLQLAAIFQIFGPHREL
jgi:hypothetical protein